MSNRERCLHNKGLLSRRLAAARNRSWNSGQMVFPRSGIYTVKYLLDIAEIEALLIDPAPRVPL